MGTPTKAAACPFCKKEISAEIARFGGNCPQCMIEIPGEEAATDPGAKAKAAQFAEDRRAYKKSPVIPAAVMSVLIVAGIGGYVYSQREEPIIMVETEELYIVPSSEHHLTEAEELALASATGTGTVAGSVPGGSGASSSHRSGETKTSIGGSVPAGEPAAVAEGSVVPRPGGDFNPSLGGLGATVTRKDLDSVVLKDPKDIEAMARRVISAGAPRLQQCYENRLKENPSLRGSWGLGFRVERTGKPSNVQVVGKGESDAALEECIARNIAVWQFVHIAEPLDVSKTVRFEPGGGL